MSASVQEIIQKYCKGKLSTRPEYYAGRGNTTSDLNSEMLEALYDGIKADVGHEAAKQYVAMVNQLTQTGDVSATTFLVSLYQLKDAGWKFSQAPTTAEAFTESTANELRRTGRVGASQMGILNLLGGFSSTTPATHITSAFLARHQDEIPKDVRASKSRASTSWADYHQEKKKAPSKREI